MLNLGKTNLLPVSRIDADVYVDGGELGEIVLQEGRVENFNLGDKVSAFVFIDGHGLAQATLRQPKAQAGEVAWLKALSVGHAGAFMDWGLPKDLLVPFSEQNERMLSGRYYLVYLFLDESNRIAASAHLEDFIQEQAFYVKAGQPVDLIIAGKTDLGYKAVADNKFWGLLYANEVFRPLAAGDRLPGFIKAVRPDQKVDLCLSLTPYPQKIDDAGQKILAALEKNGGFLAVTDHSDPQTIYAWFGVSKKVFKQSIGGLYKQRKIIIEPEGLRLP